MDVTELRARQGPLKERYAAEPAAARTSLEAIGDWRDPNLTCTVESWAGPVRAGLHAATGGDGQDACSGDMLLQALIACAGVTMRSVAAAMGLDLREVRLRAEGFFDARGTLGMDRSVPVGVQAILVTAQVDTHADDAALARLAERTERYCVVAQSLQERPRFVVERV